MMYHPETKSVANSAPSILMTARQRFYDARRDANLWLGRAIFGNANPLTLNMRGFWDLYRFRHSGVVPALFDTNVDVESMRRIGYALLSERYSSDLMGAILEKFEELIAAGNYERDKRNTRDGELYRYHIADANLFIPEIKNLLNANLRAALRNYYGSHFEVMRVNVWRNLGITEVLERQGIYATRWHCDNRRPSVVKLMINLSDVTEKDGPFHIKSRDQTRDAMRRGYRWRGDYGTAEEVVEDPSTTLRLVGPAGSGILCNTELCLHRAGAVAPGRHRDLISFKFRPARTPLPEDWWQHKGFEFF